VTGLFCFMVNRESNS